MLLLSSWSNGTNRLNQPSWFWRRISDSGCDSDSSLAFVQQSGSSRRMIPLGKSFWGWWIMMDFFFRSAWKCCRIDKIRAHATSFWILLVSAALSSLWLLDTWPSLESSIFLINLRINGWFSFLFSLLFILSRCGLMDSFSKINLLSPREKRLPRRQARKKVLLRRRALAAKRFFCF